MTIPRTFRAILSGAGLLTLALLAGCASKETKAIDQAKSQAITTNTPQQVQFVDGNGNTVTKTVEPPAAQGQQPAISTLITPPPPGPKPHSTDPVITPLGSAAQNSPAQGPSEQTSAGTAPQQGPAASVSVNVPAGTELAIRIDQRISAKSSRAGDKFTGEIVDPVLASDNSILVAKGSLVGGVVDVSHRRGHFKGASLLELRLTSLTLNGTQYPLTTRDLAERKKGKGRRSTALIGGGAGLGMLVGGIATGGVGLVVGGLIGGGAGTAAAGLTGNRDLDIPAESIVHFKLADDLVVQP